jgi:hypothetical protein
MQSILPSQAGLTDRGPGTTDLLRVKQTLTSNENLEKVVRRTDLNSLVASDRDLAVQVGKLRRRSRSPPSPDNLFEISATANVSGFSNARTPSSPPPSSRACSTCSSSRISPATARETGQTLQFLDEELRRREAALQEAEQRRVEFEQRFLGVLPGEGSIAQRMSAARTELAGIEQQLMQAQSSLAAMRGQLAATPRPFPAPSGGGGTASGQLARSRASSPRPMAAAGPTPIPTSSRSRRSPGCGRRRRASAGNTPAACPIRPTSRCARWSPSAKARSPPPARRKASSRPTWPS